MKTIIKITTLLFGLFIALNCSSVKTENDLKEHNLRGKVKSFSEYSYKAESKFGNLENGKRERRKPDEYDKQIKFNKQGEKIEDNGYNSNGSILFKLTFKYKYDEKGNMIEVIIYDSDGRVKGKKILNINKNVNFYNRL